jgi:hypothetical protein
MPANPNVVPVRNLTNRNANPVLANRDPTNLTVLARVHDDRDPALVRDHAADANANVK